MACVNFSGWESGDNSEFRSSTGTNSVQTSVVRTGVYALQVNPTTSAVGNMRLGGIRADGRPNGEMSVNSLYTRFYFRIGTAPASSEEQFIEMADTGGSTKCYFTLNSSRQIKAYSNSGALIATGATALSVDTWYRIEIQTSTGSGNQAYEVKIDGTSEISGTMNQLTNQHGSLYIGKRTNLNSQTINFYYDDIYCDDSAFPGAGQSVRLAPTANGATAQWTSGTGSSNYLEVDEIPPSTSDYLQNSVSTNQAHYVTLESTSTKSVSGTINSVKSHIYAREGTSGTSSNQLKLKSGATTVDTTAYNHSTTNQHILKLNDTDPNTASAWTTSAIDSIEVGVLEANAIAMRCMYMAAYVDFVPGAGTQTITGSGLSSTATLGSATIGRGAVNIGATGKSSSVSFGSSVISSSVNISGNGLASNVTFGSAAIGRGAVNISASGLSSSATFGSADISTGSVNVSASGLSSSVSFGSATVSQGAITINASGLDSSLSFGAATITTGSVNISASGLDSSVTFGAAAISQGSININASGLDSSASFGSAVITTGAVNISASGLSSGATFGSATISQTIPSQDIQANGLSSTNTFGSASITVGTATISASGLDSSISFGSATITTGVLTIEASSLSSSLTFGSATITQTSAIIQAAGLPSGVSFGSATLSSGAVIIAASGIISSLSFGIAAISQTYSAGLKLETGLFILQENNSALVIEG